MTKNPLEEYFENINKLNENLESLSIMAISKSMQEGTYEEIYGDEACKREAEQFIEMYNSIPHDEELIVNYVQDRGNGKEREESTIGRYDLDYSLEKEVYGILTNADKASINIITSHNWSVCISLNGKGFRVDNITNLERKVLYENKDKTYGLIGSITCINLNLLYGH